MFSSSGQPVSLKQKVQHASGHSNMANWFDFTIHFYQDCLWVCAFPSVTFLPFAFSHARSGFKEKDELPCWMAGSAPMPECLGNCRKRPPNHFWKHVLSQFVTTRTFWKCSLCHPVYVSAIVWIQLYDV